MKLDKTAPTAALSVAAGILGENGWYTSNVTVATTGRTRSGARSPAHRISRGRPRRGPGSSMAPAQTMPAFHRAAPMTVKLDKSAPCAVVAVSAGTAGENGWYTTNVTVATNGSGLVSGPVGAPQIIPDEETTGHGLHRVLHKQGGPQLRAAPLTVKLDKPAPSALLEVATGDGRLERLVHERRHGGHERDGQHQ